MRIIQTLCQASASAAVTFGAFALPLALFLCGQMGDVMPEFEELPVFEASAMMFLPPPPPPASPASEGTDAAAAAPTLADAAPAAAGPRPMLQRPGDGPTRPSAEKKSTAKKGKKQDCLEPNAAINKTGDATFAVDRDIVKYYGGHLRELNDLGWASVHKDSAGKADGFQIRGIRCGNDLHQAGIHNSDVIHAVNGKPVHSIPQALLVYAKLKRKDTIVVDITRQGQTRRITYELG